MRDLAERLLPVYEEKDTDRYLANLAALQLVAGSFAAAHDTRQLLRERRSSANPARPAEREILYDIYARARSIETASRIHFAPAFSQAFREVVPKLNDRDAHAVTKWFETPPSVFQDALQKSFDRWRPKGSIPQAEAVDVVWTYFSFDAHRSFRPLVDALDVEEERRRYVTEENVVIKTRYGAQIHALVVRPKSITTPLPALLEFTIYVSESDAKGAAAHGYAGVVAYTRGRPGKTRGRVFPFLNDGEDARAVIRWITQQPWSDGRVGMVGDGYSGFAAWAAAKTAPPALKAIATSSPMAPGIDFPMAGNIRQNAAYRWAHTYGQRIAKPDGRDDDAQWLKRDQAWYKSGKSYRELDRRGGKNDRVFSSWLDHPSYDRYWQKLIPFRKQFAKIDIPVLTTAGYYAGDAGALHYFTQHHRYNAKANHTLLVGPYDDDAAQRGLSPVVGGYAVDAVALVDLRELRYQWFDQIFKSASKPPLLKDRVNYQVMGANEWRNAPSLDAMSNGSLRFYLDTQGDKERYRLAQSKPARGTFVRQTVKLADRSDASGVPSTDIMGKAPVTRHSLHYVSEPLQQPMEFNGLLSGLLDFTPNKQDVDLNLTLYELLPSGVYLQLFDPYEFRASYAEDRTNRHLLEAGVRQQLKFTTERITSRRLAAGSRVVLVLGVNKRPDREINYGTGRDVSEESIADAGAPLRIQWYGGSYIDLPVRK
ncbi:MAG: CocE/NonD family hydrolase [Panacagrimonas sp.]